MSDTALRLVEEGRKPEPLKIKFTKKALERVTPGPSRKWLYDTEVGGLAMQVTPKGQKAFYFARRIQGRYRRLKIGNFPDVSVDQARKVATGYAGKVAQDKNPAEERRQARASMTLKQLWALYLNRHARIHKRTWEDDQRIYDRHLSRWEGRRIDQIKRDDVARLHSQIGKTAPYAANRTLALLSKMFSVAGAFGYEGPNPCQRIQRFGEQQRERFLDADELPRFLEAVEAEASDVFRDFFKVVLFTGQRRGNVAAMRWDELDLRRKVWTIPGEKFKTGQAVEVPLAEPVVAILEHRRQDAAEGQAYVFPNRKRNPRTPHLYEPKAAFARICERAGIEGLRVHDLRRTTASWATMQGVPYPVVARMVGHKAQGVTSIYARFDLSAMRGGFEKTVAAMLEAPKVGAKLADVKDKAGPQSGSEGQE